MSIRVFLIDDHRSVLWGLEKLIESDTPGMRVVGSATSSSEALKAVKELAPDVIILDIDLGTENGVQAIPDLLAACKAKILILTGVRDEAVHNSAILAGARGVVPKEARADIILAAIAKVHQGQFWLDRAATSRLLIEASRKNAPGHGEDPEQRKISSLTAREREIIALIGIEAGATAKVIANHLGISEHTLRNHLTSIYEKLAVPNRLALFAFAHQHKLVRPRK
jgi:DNA-binding NarL/FixJ family response regulator